MLNFLLSFYSNVKPHLSIIIHAQPLHLRFALSAPPVTCMEHFSSIPLAKVPIFPYNACATPGSERGCQSHWPKSLGVFSCYLIANIINTMPAGFTVELASTRKSIAIICLIFPNWLVKKLALVRVKLASLLLQTYSRRLEFRNLKDK